MKLPFELLRRPRTPKRRLAPTEPLEPRVLLASALAHDFTPGTYGSGPYGFTPLGEEVYFFTSEPFDASTLWTTDGTAAGTSALRQFPGPGPGSSGSLPSKVTQAGGRIYFFAYETGFGVNPWVTDGTEAGTRRLSEVARDTPGAESFHGAGGLVYFAASRRSGETIPVDMWVTDGTPQGTRVVTHPEFPAYGRIVPVAGSGNLLYFTVSSALAGTEHWTTGLWVTDGTAAGTRQLRQFATQAYDYQPLKAFTQVNGTMFFSAPTTTPPPGPPTGPTPGAELWRTDGTPERTMLVKDIRPGAEGSNPNWLTNVGGTLLFAADDTGNGPSLWRSDGTAGGTVRVLDRAPGSDVPLSPDYITEMGGAAYFRGVDSVTGGELWRSDGTPQGTSMVRDVSPGPDWGMISISGPLVAGGKLFFDGGPSAEHELWVSDGTADGTRRAADLNPAGPDYFGRDGAALDGRLIFAGGALNAGTEPWISDGTPEGTHLIEDVYQVPRGTEFLPLVPFGDDRVLVNVRDPVYADHHLYVADAANRVTHLLSDVRVANGPYANRRARTTSVLLDNGVLVFAASSDSNVFGPMHLYRTDGTPEGTYRLGDTDLNHNNFLGHASAPNLLRLGDHVYFAAGDNARGVELRRTDGTVAGTTIVKDVNPGPGGSLVATSTPDVGATLAVAGRSLFFQAMNDQLWKTDGTAEGTAMVADLNVAANRFLAVGDRLFFTQASGQAYRQLWTSDGTASGTAPVPRPLLVTGPMASFGGAAFFMSSESGEVAGLYRSDGTPGGTTRLAETGIPVEYAAAGDALYFATGADLWRTDGTPEGTLLLRRQAGSLSGVSHTLLTAVGDALYFNAWDPAYGYELWKTDGTPAGTVIVEDLQPGAASSDPRGLVNVGGTLFYTANSPADGNELRRLDTRARVVTRGMFDGPAPQAADKTALLPGGQASFANVSTHTRGVTGIVIDVFGLPRGTNIDTSDIALDVLAGSQWNGIGATHSVARGAGLGAGGSDRLTVTLPDGAVSNTWLRVTLKATADTGLQSNDVFYLGNLVGESGDSTAGNALTVTPLDLLRTRRAMSAPYDARYDFNRDGRVSPLDLAVVRSAAAQRRSLALLSAPAAPPPSASHVDAGIEDDETDVLA